MRMVISLILFVVVLSACAAPATSSAPTVLAVSTKVPATPIPVMTDTPQATATAVPFFNVHSDQPIVTKGQPGAWDDRYTDPGAVIYYDGLFHMFRNGFRGFPAESQVGYVTSPDGFSWTKQENDEPVLRTSDVPFARIAMYASSVIREGNCWVLYFYTWDTNSFPSSSVIGRATECVGTPAMAEWSVDPEPILTPGAEGEWDDQQVLAPHVLKTQDGYVMYYSGADESGLQSIGMATSTDGILWTKSNDPTTTDTPFAESDPVFQSGEEGTWDAGWVHQPRVFQTSDGWIMIYRGTSEPRGSVMKLGLATSNDGIHWQRFSGNPVFQPRDIKGVRQFWFTNALIKDDVIYLFVEGDINQTTQIYLATHDGINLP